MRRHSLAGMLAIVTTLAGCSGADAPKQGAEYNGNWQLATVNGQAVPATITTASGATHVVSGHLMFFRIDDNTGTGTFRDSAYIVPASSGAPINLSVVAFVDFTTGGGLFMGPKPGVTGQGAPFLALTRTADGGLQTSYRGYTYVYRR